MGFDTPINTPNARLVLCAVVHGPIGRVARIFEFDSKEPQPLAYRGVDYRRVLSDTAREHERVQSTQGRYNSSVIAAVIRCGVL